MVFSHIHIAIVGLLVVMGLDIQQLVGETEETEHYSRQCVLHSFDPAFQENALELHQYLIVHVYVRFVIHQMNKL